MRIGSVLLLAALLGSVACEPSRQARLEEVLRRSRLGPERTVELESQFLADPDPDVRALAVWAIGDTRAAGALTVLAGLASDPEPVVRVAVVKALCGLADPGSLDPVVSLASDTDAGVRRAAVRCLASSPSPPPSVLARALLDEDRETRASALEALARRPDPSATPQLLKVFESDQIQEQLAAVAALRAARDPAALPAFERAAASRLPLALRDAVESAILELRAAALEAQQAPPAPRESGAPSSGEPRGKPTGEEHEEEVLTPSGPQDVAAP